MEKIYLDKKKENLIIEMPHPDGFCLNLKTRMHLDDYIDSEMIYDEQLKFVKDKVILSVPLKSKRFNPYEDMATGNGCVGDMDNIVGVICGKKIGFSYWIDMDYKGKEDQISSIFYYYQEVEDNFKKLCKDLGIEFYKYPVCAECGEVMYGCFTFKDGKDVCIECSEKNN